MKEALKHCLKLLLGKPDLKWEFIKFERTVPSRTWELHRDLLSWAIDCSAKATELESDRHYAESMDPVVRQGHDLSQKALAQFKGKFSGGENLRLLIFVPSLKVSPAGNSLLNNLIHTLKFMGVQAAAMEWDDTIEQHLDTFNPTAFLIGDEKSFLERINWGAVERYRQKNLFKLGLSASLEEYGNSPLTERLKWAKKQQVDFFFSFRSPEYLHAKNEYSPFRAEGYRILTLEFGANPLIYYPVPGIARDIDFIFMGSGNYGRYVDYMSDIIRSRSGFLAGQGWTHVGWAPRDCHRYLYARAKAGLNIHGQYHIDWACELTERTYILAACGVPQLVDNPKLLPQRFGDGCFFVAETPSQYARMFDEMLAAPDEAQRRALKAQKEVFEKHTTFHRADGFVRELLSL